MYGLGQKKNLNFVPRDRENQKNFLFTMNMIFCKLKSSATLFEIFFLHFFELFFEIFLTYFATNI